MPEWFLIVQDIILKNGNWTVISQFSQDINPCIKLPRALLSLMSILSRLKVLVHKNRGPAWFPVTHQDLLPAVLLQTSVISSVACGPLCLQSPQFEGVQKEKPTLFHGSFGISIHFRMYLLFHFLTEGCIQIYKGKRGRKNK